MSDIEKAIRQICEEKNIPYEAVIGTIEAALAAAYRKDFGEKNQNIKVEFSAETGGSRVFDEKTIVADELYNEAIHLLEEREKLRAEGKLVKKELTEEEREKEKELALYPKLHIPLTEAAKIKDDAIVGEILRIELPLPAEYGRMAEQTAKQVVIQRLRETERDIIFNEIKEQEGHIVVATVQRKEGRIVILDVGRATGIMLPEDQIYEEFYRTGQRLKVYIKSVEKTLRGPEILLSRTHADIVKKLFESEIPEIASGVVEIRGIAREAGSRSKVAVVSSDANIDPICSCIGQRGARIQTIINELGCEKIDIIMYSEDPAVYITHALSQAKVISLDIDVEKRTAVAKVVASQFSLAIGKGGQNVRLAAKLTGWNINVKEVRDDDVKPAELAVTLEGAVSDESGDAENAPDGQSAAGEAAAPGEPEAVKNTPEDQSADSN